MRLFSICHILSLPPVPLPAGFLPISVSPGQVAKAILSFPAGLAGGPDGLHTQHLKDLLIAPHWVCPLLSFFITTFISLVLNGETPVEIYHLFFGARLTAINKREVEFTILLWNAL